MILALPCVPVVITRLGTGERASLGAQTVDGHRDQCVEIRCQR